IIIVARAAFTLAGEDETPYRYDDPPGFHGGSLRCLGDLCQGASMTTLIQLERARTRKPPGLGGGEEGDRCHRGPPAGIHHFDGVAQPGCTCRSCGQPRARAWAL